MSNYRYPEKECLICQKKFLPRRKEARFCSQKCSLVYMRKNKVGFFASVRRSDFSFGKRDYENKE